MFKRRFDFQNVDKRECVQQTLELQFNIASAWMKKDHESHLRQPYYKAWLCLSRMIGNYHVRFWGGENLRRSTYPKNPCLLLLVLNSFSTYFRAHSKESTREILEEVKDDDKSPWPLWIGRHTRYNGYYNGKRWWKSERIPKDSPSSDCFLQLENMKLESLVIVDEHATVNLSLIFAHTARHTMGVGFSQVVPKRLGCCSGLTLLN
jgi:hypothetical protein